MTELYPDRFRNWFLESGILKENNNQGDSLETVVPLERIRDLIPPSRLLYFFLLILSIHLDVFLFWCLQWNNNNKKSVNYLTLINSKQPQPHFYQNMGEAQERCVFRSVCLFPSPLVASLLEEVKLNSMHL